MVIETEKQAFARRLNCLLDYHRVPPKGKGRQKALSEVIGVSQIGARKWLEGESIPSHKNILAIVHTYRCHPAWLEYGTGLPEMDNNHLWAEHNSISQEAPKPMEIKEEKARYKASDLNSLFKGLSEKHQQMVLGLMASLQQGPNIQISQSLKGDVDTKRDKTP